MAVIAVGGGKGGVGRTLVASGLAVFIAQLGKKVLLVDGHPFAPHLAMGFGVARVDGNVPPWVTPPHEARGAETVVPNLRVLAANSELGAVAGITLRRPREVAAASGADHCVLDLGFGVSTIHIDAMLESDTMVLVTTPEPVAIEAFYRWIRHAYARTLARALKGRPVETSALHATVRAAGGPPVPARLAEEIAAVSPAAALAAWATLSRVRARLVVNASRSRADLDLGESIAIVARQRLGVSVDYLGHVEYDDAVVLAARRRRPLLVDAPGAKASRNLERIARRLVAAESAHRGERLPPPPEGPPPTPTHYEVLALDRGASDEEIRRAYRRMREVYGPESLAVSGLLTGSELAMSVARIEEARDVLLDPALRRPYDLSITSAEDLRLGAELSMGHAEPEPESPLAPPPELTPETEYTGELLRAIREARGIDLRDVAARTKISIASLRAIENEEYASLPAVVYLRGFVGELAKFLKLDVEQVSRSYLRRHRRSSEP